MPQETQSTIRRAKAVIPVVRDEDFVREYERAMRDVYAVMPLEERDSGRREGGFGNWWYIEGTQVGERDPVLIGTIVRPKELGEGVEDDYLKRQRLAPRKNEFLFASPGCDSSFELRDPSNEVFGGAISGDREQRRYVLLSFSGFPELADEMIVLLVGLRLKLITLARATKIAWKSQNHYFFRHSWDLGAMLRPCYV